MAFPAGTGSGEYFENMRILFLFNIAATNRAALVGASAPATTAHAARACGLTDRTGCGPGSTPTSPRSATSAPSSPAADPVAADKCIRAVHRPVGCQNWIHRRDLPACMVPDARAVDTLFACALKVRIEADGGGSSPGLFSSIVERRRTATTV
jgi:hypothetical protein